MTCTDTLAIPPGSDWRGRTIIRDDSGAAIDATGWTASIRDETGDLAGALAIAWIDAPSGEVELTLTWQAGWPLTGGVRGTFRIALVNGSDERVTLPSEVLVYDAATEVTVPRGSDLTIDLVWPDDRNGADLTGETVEAVNVAAGLVGLVSVTVVDPATRTVRWHIEGDPATAMGDLGTFQLRRSIAGAERRTLPLIRIISA